MTNLHITYEVSIISTRYEDKKGDAKRRKRGVSGDRDFKFGM